MTRRLYCLWGDGVDLMETTMLLFVAVIAALLMPGGQALAAIRIIDSTYEDGLTIISGQAKPHEKVILDGEYTTTADAGGRFEFHVRHKPNTCMSNIVAGEDSYSALLTGCLASDAAADAARTNATAPTVSRSPSDVR